MNILRMSANCSGVRRANIIMMAALILSSFVLLACGMSSCGRFNQSYLVEQAFGFNLREASVGKTIEEKNGLFIVRGVSEFDPIIKQTFSLAQGNVYQSTTYVPVQFEGNELGNQDWGRTTARKWGNLDGFVQMAVYYPEKQLLLFGYFSAYGG